LRIYSTLLTHNCALSFRTFIIAFLYAAALFNIVFNKALFIIIRGKAPKTSNISTRPLSPIVSLTTLRAVYNAFSLKKPSDSDLIIS
jgi:hypothetical protein